MATDEPTPADRTPADDETVTGTGAPATDAGSPPSGTAYAADGSLARAARPGFFARLYTGTGAFNIVGRRRVWYVVLGTLVVVCLGSILVRGFNLGIDFRGGTQVQLPSVGAVGTIRTDQVAPVVRGAVGLEPESVQTVGSGSSQSVLIKMPTLRPDQVVAMEAGLFTQFQPLGKDGKPSRTAISDSGVSGSWGGEITQQALIALIVFLVLVSLFIGIYFERNMALAALVALVHDVLITAGVYSLTGLEVTPATVIGLLTILGFSLYDTVVVFDKVQENTRGLLGLTRRTYPEAANLAVNQTLMRSINTSLIAVLPVLGLLIVGLGILGVGTLGDLALVQLVGLLAGSLSSILLATPLLVDLTMRRKSYRLQAQRVQARRASARQRPVAARTATTGPADAAAPARRTDGGAADDDSQAGDDLADELRHERAIAAATGVPARTPSQVDARRRAAATGGRTGRPAGKGGRGGKPAGKGGKPTGRRSH